MWNLRITGLNSSFNTLKLSGYYMYHQVEHTTVLHSARTVYLCGSENKQRKFFYTTLTGWFL